MFPVRVIKIVSHFVHKRAVKSGNSQLFLFVMAYLCSYLVGMQKYQFSGVILSWSNI